MDGEYVELEDIAQSNHRDSNNLEVVEKGFEKTAKPLILSLPQLT